MTAPRRLWIGAVVAGVIAFICSSSFGRIPGLTPCGPSGGLSAIMAFEFVRSPAEVGALFGAEPCRSTLIAAQRTGVLLDNFGFIPAYTVFLALAALATGIGWRRWLASVLLVAGLSDEIEGVLLWTILGALPGTQAQIGALGAAVHLKFALLALGTFGVGWAVRSTTRGWWRLPGLVVAAGGLYAALEFALGNVGAMMQGFTVGWFALLATALTFSLFGARGGLPPAPVRPAA